MKYSFVLNCGDEGVLILIKQEKTCGAQVIELLKFVNGKIDFRFSWV